MSSTSRRLSDIDALSVWPLLQTPDIFTRFLRRAGPVLETVAAVDDLLTWRQPLRSTLALAFWVLLCLSPAWTWLAGPPVGAVLAVCWLAVAKPEQASTSTTTSTADSVEELGVTLLRINWVLGESMLALDRLADIRRDFSWHRSPDKVRRVVGGVAVMGAAWVLVQLFVPIWWQLLLAGVFLMLVRSPLAPVLCASMPTVSQLQTVPKLAALASTVKHNAAELLPTPPASCQISRSSSANFDVDSDSTTDTQVLYEHQRYWLGLGWIAHLLPDHDPPAWTDGDGRPVPAEHCCQLLPQFSPVDTQSDDGWLYGGHDWRHLWQPRPHWWTYTRRRRWQRK